MRVTVTRFLTDWQRLRNDSPFASLTCRARFIRRQVRPLTRLDRSASEASSQQLSPNRLGDQASLLYVHGLTGRTGCSSRSLRFARQIELHATLTHPAHDSARIADNNREVRNVPCDNRARSDECVAADRVPANYGSIGSN